MKQIEKRLLRHREMAKDMGVSESAIDTYGRTGTVVVYKFEIPGQSSNQCTIRYAHEEIRLPKSIILKVSAFAKFCSVSVSTVYRWIDHNLLKARIYKTPKQRTIRITGDSVNKFLINHRMRDLAIAA